MQLPNAHSPGCCYLGTPSHVEPRIEALHEVYRRYLSDQVTRPAPATLQRAIAQASDTEIISQLQDLARKIFDNDMTHVRDRDQSLADTMLVNAPALYTHSDNAQMRRIM